MAGATVARKGVVFVGRRVGERVADRLPHQRVRVTEIFSSLPKRQRPQTETPKETRQQEDVSYGSDIYLDTIMLMAVKAVSETSH